MPDDVDKSPFDVVNRSEAVHPVESLDRRMSDLPPQFHDEFAATAERLCEREPLTSVAGFNAANSLEESIGRQVTCNSPKVLPPSQGIRQRESNQAAAR